MKWLQLLISLCLLGMLGASCFEYGSLQVRAASAKAPVSRQYYVSRTPVTGNAALTACAAGYHMASMFEIYDVSTLQYDAALGVTRPDSGSGPPVSVSGWIRTGSRGATGLGNFGGATCSAWTTNSSNESGSAVHLNLAGSPDGHTVMSTWWFDREPGTAYSPKCSSKRYVWCVQD